MKSNYIEAGILFFDVHGYSKLDEVQLNSFHEVIWPHLNSYLTENGFLYINTWGDGIIILHQDYEQLAHIALDIRDYFNHNKYTDIDIFYKTILRPRIALHKGEFLESEDPFLNRKGYFGKEIVRCARIEPIIPPGHVWATKEVKVSIKNRFTNQGKIPTLQFDFRGELPLAKAFGSEELYEILRINEIVQIKSEENIIEQNKVEIILNTKTSIVPPESTETINDSFSQRIFIVHGHDEALKNDLARFLGKLNLEPVILHEQPSRGHAILSKLTGELADIGYAFILLTPDDIGYNIKESDNQRYRARQNVIFEYGLLLSHLGNQRLCVICKGDVELPSDLNGILNIVMPIDGNVNSIGIDIIKELKAAGYNLNTDNLF